MSAFPRLGGPFFDDLRIGDIFDTAPAVTLTEEAGGRASGTGRRQARADH